MPTSYDSEKMSIVMSGHETCKYGKKIERKNSWARECIFSSHRPQKSMKNKRINIKEEKFRILLENWSRYRSEEISPVGCSYIPKMDFELMPARTACHSITLRQKKISDVYLNIWPIAPLFCVGFRANGKRAQNWTKNDNIQKWACNPSQKS